MKSLQHHWYSSSVFVWLLLPLSWLYCLIVLIRKKLYQANFLKSFSTDTPLIVVGNIVAGGSGKTPLLIALCDLLQKAGHRPGVVSRGYGGAVEGIKQVTNTDSADIVGDEPLMIYQRTKAPVVVGADRVAAVNFLLQNNDCNVVLSDDGLQHYRMGRDLEIVVVDAQREFGNGFCIPAGPLRERVSRLDDVDLVVYNGEPRDSSNVYNYKLDVISLSSLTGNENRQLSDFAGLKVHAVAGIGFPQRFFELLQKAGIEVVEHAFSDHSVYKQSDFSDWYADCILMTEKDAVKCTGFELADAWVVSVSAVMSEQLESELNNKLSVLMK